MCLVVYLCFFICFFIVLCNFGWCSFGLLWRNSHLFFVLFTEYIDIFIGLGLVFVPCYLSPLVWLIHVSIYGCICRYVVKALHTYASCLFKSVICVFSEDVNFVDSLLAICCCSSQSSSFIVVIHSRIPTISFIIYFCGCTFVRILSNASMVLARAVLPSLNSSLVSSAYSGHLLRLGF